MSLTEIDLLWLMCASGLVLSMQAGFLCLEAGLTRSKNAVNVALKNLTDLTVSVTAFWLVGFGVMFGTTCGGWYGDGAPEALMEGDAGVVAFFVFQSLFCATAATILTGAVAERTRFSAYLATVAVISGLTYPFIGHWCWGGALTGEPGLLEARGFFDFAGSGVVHMTGGFAGLAAVLVIGPRIGRFSSERRNQGFPKSSFPQAMLGALLLLVGWIGFNGGSTIAFDERVPAIVMKTLLAAAAGGIGGAVISSLAYKRMRPESTINGLLAGLVAVTASAHVISPNAALVIGLLGAFAAIVADYLLERLEIDDAIGAFPVHGAAGSCGLVCAGAFADLDTLGTDLTRLELIGVQSLGALVIAGCAFSTVYITLLVVKRVTPIRVTPEEEQDGLNVSEHGVESELQVICRGLSEAFGPGGTETREAAKMDLIDTSDDAGRLISSYSELLDRVAKETQLAAYAQAQEDRSRLLESQSGFLRAVLDAVDAYLCILDDNGVVLEANRLWGTLAIDADQGSTSIPVGADFFDLCDRRGSQSEELIKLADATRAVIRGDRPSYHSEHSWPAPEGTRWFQTRVSPLRDVDRGSCVLVMIDCTERVSAEQRSEGMATLLKEMTNELYVVDPTTERFVEVNQGALDALGYTAEEIMLMSPLDISENYNRENIGELIARIDESQSGLFFEDVHCRKDGSTYPVMLHGSPRRFLGRDVHILFGVDLSERRELEAKLSQAQKLESLGQLAAGVAHEINTPMQFIATNVEFLSKAMPRVFDFTDAVRDMLASDSLPPSVAERLNELSRIASTSRFDQLREQVPSALSDCGEGVERVVEIVGAMKEFSHPGVKEKVNADLNNCVRGAATLARNRWKEIANVEYDLDPDLPVYRCLPGELNQTLLNLIVNAADAIADKGRDEHALGVITLRTRAEIDGISIDVSDTGCGIPDEMIDRIFDPFFTTKDVGKGTGQGLALAHHVIVNRHGGTIDVDSTPGVGATFRLFLPHADPEDEVAEHEAQSALAT